MSHFPDDVLSDDFAAAEQRQKRLRELSTWVEMFAEEHRSAFSEQLVIAPSKVSLTNTCYWETVEACIRPHLIVNGGKRIIDRHKIASATELSVCFCEPIDKPDPEEKTEINARLAFYIGLNIIGNWDPDKIKTLFVSQSFNREHLAWLREVNRRRDYQIFSNAATWFLIELICAERTART